MSGDRKLWIDSLRGLAMLMVVYGHSVQGWTPYFVVTSPIKMPLFFVITAFLFNTRQGNSKLFYKNIFFRLFIPWMLLGLFPYTHPLQRFLDLISGEKLWFMPCIIWGQIIWFYINKLSHSDVQVCIAGLLCSVVGGVLAYYEILCYSMFNTACVIQVFFVLGHILRKYEGVIFRHERLRLIFFSTGYVALCICSFLFFRNEIIDVHKSYYFNIPFCFTIIVFGLSALFFLFRVYNYSPKWLVFVGQNTLPIYLLHSHVITITKRIFVFLDYDSSQLPIYFSGLIFLLVSVLVCSIFAFFANRYCPIVIGNKRVKV